MSAARREARPPSSSRGQAGASDAELLRRIAAGDLTALGVLYDRHADEVRAFAARATRRSGDAEDVVHETFLTVVKAAGAHDGRESVRPFLVGIAARLVRRRRRALGRLGQVLADLARSLPAIAPRTPEDLSGAGERLRAFDRALGRLSEEKRLVFLMIEGEGLSGEEVARALEIPVATVRTRLHHARKEIRAAMTRGSAR